MAQRLNIGSAGLQSGRRLLTGLAAGHAYRLGEAAVVSTNVHVLQADEPGVVTVLADTDAGQVFYGRTAIRDVCHVDVFHALADVDHRAVAAALRSLVAESARFGRTGTELADYIDIQTATGGGRITGSLAFGQRLTLREAHRHHIHLTVWRPGLGPNFLPEAVDRLEQLLLARGVQLRRVERLLVSRGGGRAVDLSDYTDRTDSYLRHQHLAPTKQGGPASRGAGASSSAAPAASGSPNWRRLAELSDAAGGLGRLQSALEAVAAGIGRSQFGAAHSLALLRQLEAAGLVSDQRGRLSLSGEGRRLGHLLRDQLFEMERGLRRSYRLTHSAAARADGSAQAWGPRGHSLAAGRARDVRPVPSESGPLSLDPAATVVAALRRRAASGAAVGPLTIARQDWRDHVQRQRVPPSVFLLIDCSASMAGRRLQAAKFLTRYLLVAARARVAVMSFQADQTDLVLPFTRRYSEADRGLHRLAPAGLTPLARGLVQATDLLRAEKSRRPLLLLITDGIPTVPLTSDNPVADALAAAALVAEQRLTFGCIGLEPSRSYLTAIAEKGKGSLYILEDLEEDGLVAAAHDQLARHYAKTHGRRRHG